MLHIFIYLVVFPALSLRPLDVEFMRRLSKVVNIVPVIAKADTLTLEERDFFKKKVMFVWCLVFILQHFTVSTIPFILLSIQNLGTRSFFVLPLHPCIRRSLWSCNRRCIPVAALCLRSLDSHKLWLDSSRSSRASVPFFLSSSRLIRPQPFICMFLLAVCKNLRISPSLISSITPPGLFGHACAYWCAHGNHPSCEVFCLYTDSD